MSRAATDSTRARHHAATSSLLTAVPSESARELRAEIARGQRLDRGLAHDLGRREPVRSAGAGEYAEALDRRPPLSQAEERELVLAAKSGDRAARAQLVAAFMPLIAATARTYRSRHVQRLELLQEGIVGLLRGLERFDPERGVPFWGYATWWVRQAMQQLVAELTRPVVLSDRALRHLARVKQAHGEAVQETGREPNRDELARRSGLSLEQVDERNAPAAGLALRLKGGGRPARSRSPARFAVPAAGAAYAWSAKVRSRAMPPPARAAPAGRPLRSGSASA